MVAVSNLPSSGPQLQPWQWSEPPSAEQLSACLHTLQREQMAAAAQASLSCLSVVRIRQRVAVARRYFTALTPQPPADAAETSARAATTAVSSHGGGGRDRRLYKVGVEWIRTAMKEICSPRNGVMDGIYFYCCMSVGNLTFLGDVISISSYASLYYVDGMP